MIAKSVKSTDFADFTGFGDFNVDFVDFNADFDVDFSDFDADFALKLVKLTISFHSTVRIWKSAKSTDFAEIHSFS